MCVLKFYITDQLIFKECFVRDIIKVLPVDEVYLDSTKITVLEGHISTDVAVDALS